MRRITTILLFVCYLIPCMGMSVNIHYCGGKVKSVSLISSNNTRCACSKKTMKKGCCQDKVAFIKAPQDHNIQKTISYPSFKTNFSNSEVLLYSSIFGSNYKAGRILTWTDPPPAYCSLNLYLLNQVFRI